MCAVSDSWIIIAFLDGLGHRTNGPISQPRYSGSELLAVEETEFGAITWVAPLPLIIGCGLSYALQANLLVAHLPIAAIE